MEHPPIWFAFYPAQSENLANLHAWSCLVHFIA